MVEMVVIIVPILGEAVMVVGVGHLVGPDSVPALLRARGVVVEGP